ncbi:hypothetical protein AX16_008950 [Volvariella volvacea WC 439]|nr:hypothetical protein AX16_008950 [Volvariella volvacea WC 439]
MLNISFFKLLRSRLSEKDLFYFLDNLIDAVSRATGNHLKELTLDTSGVVELTSLPDVLTKLNSLDSLTFKYSCGKYCRRFTGPSRGQCCAAPFAAKQLSTIIQNNPHLRSFEYRYRCSNTAPRLCLSDVLPSSLESMKIEKLIITGYPLSAPIRTGVLTPPFPTLNNLQHLKLLPERSFSYPSPQQHANIDRFWNALTSTGVALKSITTRYVSLAFLKYLASFRGLKACVIPLPRGCFSPPISFTDLRSAYASHSATLEKLSIYSSPATNISGEYGDLLYHNPLTCNWRSSWVEPLSYPKLQVLLIPCLYEAEITQEDHEQYMAYFSQFPAMRGAAIWWFDGTALGGTHAYRGMNSFQLVEGDTAGVVWI